MPWKKGVIKLADGTTYPAELLIERGREVWNMKIHSETGVFDELEFDNLSQLLDKPPNDIYPFTYQVEK
ncbi:hypothetical protein [Alkaliphilus serpentinus]|uniref:Uncharacterized protein n=1 Tax=Alkaliphilus serpentinus TaxID=1482731 RepID=A0A833HR45_9FIRM|nr:hypothetical protein [Alkaliphilus serpentinus]KAB3532520.1 hypothetical protein F8153_02465 [Alkaliphilus serpentinus]